MESLEKYRFWLEHSYFDAETKQELLSMEHDVKEIEDRFYKDLEFGTGGLRGIIGAGTNRINIYTIRKASQGFANFILSKGSEAARRGVVIAYDSRHYSPQFAMEAAQVFCGNGIPAYLFSELRPTPQLSFAIRQLHAYGGVVITASHNPKEYNGYKAYGFDGAQLGIRDSDAVIEEVNRLEDITKVRWMKKEDAMSRGLLHFLEKDMDDAYMKALKSVSIHAELSKDLGKSLQIVYTPFHGAGNLPVRRILHEMGFSNVHVVKKQELPDPDFTTVPYPNPEDPTAFHLAIEKAKEVSADLIIGTDPDCDRVGVLVKSNAGEYFIFTGNQTGCLLLEYILSQKKENGTLPSNAFAVKTVVTSNLANIIAKNYNVELLEVLTGFKFIGEKIRELDECGDKQFIFGFEESYGYLAGTYARDKDGVVATMLICEMAAFYQSKGMTLYDALQNLYRQYGFTKEDISTFTLQGKDGMEKIKTAMTSLRNTTTNRFGTFEVLAKRDYLKGIRVDVFSQNDERIDLPSSDVLYYEFDNAWFCIRPSGTEPKIKVYFGMTAPSMDVLEHQLQLFKKEILHYIEKLL